MNVRAVASGHTAELQFVHEKMAAARKGMRGHASYNTFRGAAELLESCA